MAVYRALLSLSLSLATNCYQQCLKGDWGVIVLTTLAHTHSTGPLAAAQVNPVCFFLCLSVIYDQVPWFCLLQYHLFIQRYRLFVKAVSV